jgi:hypothetical protein
MEGIRYATLDDRDQGKILLAIVVPKGEDNWGVMAPLQGTRWGDLICVVPGEAMSHALHGWATPLVRVLGPTPRDLVRKLSVTGDTTCGLSTTCAFVTPKCVPGPKLPDCYEPPDLTGEQAQLATFLALAWREGRYVVRVEGVEFSIT